MIKHFRLWFTVLLKELQGFSDLLFLDLSFTETTKTTNDVVFLCNKFDKEVFMFENSDGLDSRTETKLKINSKSIQITSHTGESKVSWV